MKLKINEPITFVLWLIAVTLLFYLSCPEKDDTDPPDSRSGMRLYQDYRTGCYYLSNGYFGSITPRLDKDGKQICEGK